MAKSRGSLGVLASAARFVVATSLIAGGGLAGCESSTSSRTVTANPEFADIHIRSLPLDERGLIASQDAREIAEEIVLGPGDSRLASVAYNLEWGRYVWKVSNDQYKVLVDARSGDLLEIEFL